MLRAVVTDLDGVIRLFPPERDQAIEEKFRLPAGAIYEAAFAPGLLQLAITGRIPDEIWRERVAQSLRTKHKNVDCQSAVSEWSESPGTVDADVLWALRSFCGQIPLALLTNATSRLEFDLRKLDILRNFDFIFSSSLLGVAKPDPRVYDKVTQALKLSPEEILFIDDSAANVAAAQKFGWRAVVYKDLSSLRTDLNNFSL